MRGRRDHAAIAYIASLLPTDPEEANLAVQYVAASAQALDCLRLARDYPSDTALILKCAAQSASMMRQAMRWRTALLRAQAARQMREADTVAIDTTAQFEHRALGVMVDARAHAPPSPEPVQAELP